MKSAVLDIEGNNKITVTAPNVEGSGTSETVFKGSRKPHQKECVLIIDHETGEITLEKLSQNIIVKRTRQQNNGKSHKQISQRPNTPIETKKSVPQLPHHKPNSPLTKSQNSPNKHKLSPNKANGQQFSQQYRNSPSQPISPSMPTLSALSTLSSLSATIQPSVSASTSSKRDINEALGLSDSSSDSSDHESSSSTSSSSSSDSSSDSSDEEEAQKPVINTNHITPNKSNVKAKSSSFSSDSDSDNEAFNRRPNGTIGTTTALPSMPKFSQLSAFSFYVQSIPFIVNSLIVSTHL
jgi:ELL-associated factor